MWRPEVILFRKHAKRSDLKKIRETARKYVEVSQNMSNQVKRYDMAGSAGAVT